MNKGIIFALGVLTGAAAGATATYFLTRNKLEDTYGAILDEYRDHCNQRIDEITDYYEGNLGELEDDEDSSSEEELGVDPEVANNDGVKKYHHYSGGFGEDSAQKVFADVTKKEADVTEGEKALVKDPTIDDIPGIEEIDEDDFLNCPDDYYQEYLRFDFNTDTLYWGYGSDNEMEAEAHFGKSRDELIGKVWRWAPDYIKDPDEMEGAAYVRNDNLMTYFEIIMSYDPSQPVADIGGEE